MVKLTVTLVMVVCAQQQIKPKFQISITIVTKSGNNGCY